MRLSSPHLASPGDPTPQSIAALIPDLVGKTDPFAILDVDEQTYLQVLWTSAGFVLDFQEGGVAAHYRCVAPMTAEATITAFQQYLAWNGKWRPNEHYERVELRSPLFRISYRIGRLVGLLTRPFRRSP